MAPLCSNASDGGVVTLGGVDPAHYTGKLTCVPVNEHNDGLWLIKMERVTIGNDENNSPFCRGGCETSIDSGCSYLIGPPDEVVLLHKILGGTYAPNITNYVSEN